MIEDVQTEETQTNVTKTTRRRKATKTPKRIPIKSMWNSRLIVGGNKTPSGESYDFAPGAIQTVNAADYQYLLSLEPKRPNSCCGGTPDQASQVSKFFNEVD
jgi:hypothetical protein